MQGLPARRYLIPFDTRELPLRYADVLVLGSGVAGLSAALAAAGAGASVLVVTKGEAKESNTLYAQGGIAAVLDPDGSEDSHEAHARDTKVAGAGLCDDEVVELVVREGTEAVRKLIAEGARFDRTPEGQIALTKEGGHSAKRILHATGDATGAEIERTLLERARAQSRIRFLEHAFAIDLVTSHGECQGALVWDHAQGLQFVAARATVLAAGGAGRIYRETTNPPVATGDGIAMAYRAGAVLRDMEFMQFHPTTLYVAGASRKLLTEALRGEGAYLVDADGIRFMPEVHELAELAPRDVVARAIVRRLRETGGRGVFLDLRHLDAERLVQRFPGIEKICRSYGLDFTRQLVPVRPSAHYTMGGVAVDLDARTGVERLFAVGEVSCSGLHGANRLGSNSLLEGLVFGERAGRKAAELAADSLGDVARLPMETSEVRLDRRREIDIVDVLNALRAQTWRSLAIERDGASMREARERIAFWSSYALEEVFAGPLGWELQNMLTVAALVAQAAIWREESRGAHFREDFPDPDDARFLRHSAIVRPEEGKEA
ncbi:MAG: L-aspartate oxidase [Planctomycetota bacterium]|nr:MAG: L-aspartate oxidase [Planctomycetota bacterium]